MAGSAARRQRPPGRALGLMYLNVGGKTCAEVREDLMNKPIVDVWGAQVRVMCNAHIVQAVLFAIGVFIMVAFIRNAQRVEPFVRRA